MRYLVGSDIFEYNLSFLLLRKLNNRKDLIAKYCNVQV